MLISGLSVLITNLILQVSKRKDANSLVTNESILNPDMVYVSPFHQPKPK